MPVADDSEDSDQEHAPQQQQDDDDRDAGQAHLVTEFAGAATGAANKARSQGALNVALKEVQVDDAGKVKVGGRDEVGRTEMEQSSEGEYGPSPLARDVHSFQT